MTSTEKCVLFEEEWVFWKLRCSSIAGFGGIEPQRRRGAERTGEVGMGDWIWHRSILVDW